MTITVPGLSDVEHATLNLLHEQLEAKARRNRIRTAYYDMRHAVSLVGSVIPPQYWRMGIVLGWSGKAVDTLARRCNLDGFVWPDGDLDSLGMRELWEGNNLGSEVSQGTISSLIHSVSFVVNTQGEAGEPESLIHFKDAMNATGEWDARARRLGSLLSVTERGDEGTADARQMTGFALYLPGVTVTARKVDGVWHLVDRKRHAWGVPAEPLVYKPRVGRPFGSSRISRAVMSLQDQATRTAIRLEAHGDIYAIPDLWMLGADESIFKNADGSQKASWDIVMGRLKGIPDDDSAPESLARADVKQIPASDPKPHLDMLKQQAQLFSGETSIPLTSLGVSDMSNPTSADSYIASREDLIAEAEGATDDWRPALRRAVARGLAMQNGVAEDAIPSEWLTIDTKWRSPIYLSRAQQADAGMKQLTAIPWVADAAPDVALEIVGLEAQQIERVMAGRRRLEGGSILDALRQASEGAETPSEAQELKEKADALGVLIRAGVEPDDAARRVGLEGISFVKGFQPVSIRIPGEDGSDAAG